MLKKTIYLVIIISYLLFITSNPFSSEQTLKIAFGNALHPWVIPETNSGILIDIIKETLEPAGYTIEPVYVPYERRLTTYKQGKVDGVCDINPQLISDSKLEGYLSEIAYAYENIGVSLKKNGFSITRISDLVTYRLLAWQGAKTVIGGEYADMADRNKNYRELPDQKTQIKMLYAEREDVIQLDRQIFRYLRNKVSEEYHIDTSQHVDIFPLFGKNECGFLFRDKAVQITFNERLELLKKSGRYNTIFEKYAN
ncbi:MAG: transporter substrate-binding domain-containing protein [Pseudomonadota bacterium]